jgi:hypothetical protein
MRVEKRVILFIIFLGIALIVWAYATKEPVEEGPSKLKYKAVSNHEDIILAVARQYLDTGPLRDFEIRAGQTTLFKIGSPLMIKPKVQKRKSVVEIQFDIFGQAGEQYENFVRKDNRTIGRAGVQVIDEKGNVLESGKFRYG